MSLALRIAVGAYDRTLPLMAGLVGINGVAAEYVTAPLEEIFADPVAHLGEEARALTPDWPATRPTN